MCLWNAETISLCHILLAVVSSVITVTWDIGGSPVLTGKAAQQHLLAILAHDFGVFAAFNVYWRSALVKVLL